MFGGSSELSELRESLDLLLVTLDPLALEGLCFSSCTLVLGVALSALLLLRFLGTCVLLLLRLRGPVVSGLVSVDLLFERRLVAIGAGLLTLELEAAGLRLLRGDLKQTGEPQLYDHTPVLLVPYSF